jgi:SAM-dependent methyltransferase
MAIDDASPEVEKVIMRLFHPRRKGDRLVREIRARGEKVKVDLGCGFRKRGNLGIDVTRKGTAADLVCHIGFEPLPLSDNTVDKIVCCDFLEHLPKGYYSESSKRMKYPIVDLMNEIWRVLRPGGTFTSQTPCYPHVEVHRDPTHLSVWTLESMDYFCGKYLVPKIYGVKEWFELVENRMDGFYLYAVLRKPKVDKMKAEPFKAEAGEAAQTREEPSA